MHALGAALLRLHQWLVKPPPQLDPKYADFYPLSNYVHGMGLVAHVYFLALFLGLGLPWLAAFNVLSVAVFVGTVYLSRRGSLDHALLIGGLEVAAHQGLAVAFLGLGAGFQHYVLVLVMGTLFFSHIPMRLRIVMAILPTLWYLALLAYGMHYAPWLVLELRVLTVLTMVNALMFVSILMGMAIYFQYAVASARDRAERMAASKTLFLANMSHELRTPLNAILGFAQILARSEDMQTAHRAKLHSINRSGEHLLALINRILDMSKLEGGQLALLPSVFQLDDVLADVQDMFSQAAQARGLALSFVRSPELPSTLEGDALRLRQVLINLVGNAIKFTPRGQVRVEVLAAPQQPPWPRKRLHFDVRDTGLGISRAEQADLFQVFTQTESGRQSRQGTGLGLALSQRIARLMGGDMGVRSKLGFGSRFWFEVELNVVAPNLGATAWAPLPPPPIAEAELAQAAPTRLAEQLWAGALASLQGWPLAELERLHRAVQLADVDLAEQLLAAQAGNAPNHHPWLAQLLRDYRFDQLEALTSQALGALPAGTPD
jgi:signal transduction histidine kinase